MRPERLVIHGDFTNHNVIADGAPPKPVGVIDLQRAHVEVPLADIGYGLWRSGRPHQDADCLDLSMLGRFVRGYASTIAFPASAARALPVFLYGRGLQMIAERIQAGQAGTSVLAQVQWPADQHVHTQWSADAPHGSMRDACARAIELGSPAITFTDHADLTTLVVSDGAAAYIRAIGGTGGGDRGQALGWFTDDTDYPGGYEPSRYDPAADLAAAGALAVAVAVAAFAVAVSACWRLPRSHQRASAVPDLRPVPAAGEHRRRSLPCRRTAAAR